MAMRCDGPLEYGTLRRNVRRCVNGVVGKNCGPRRSKGSRQGGGGLMSAAESGLGSARATVAATRAIARGCQSTGFAQMVRPRYARLLRRLDSGIDSSFEANSR